MAPVVRRASRDCTFVQERSCSIQKSGLRKASRRCCGEVSKDSKPSYMRIESSRCVVFPDRVASYSARGHVVCLWVCVRELQHPNFSKDYEIVWYGSEGSRFHTFSMFDSKLKNQTSRHRNSRGATLALSCVVNPRRIASQRSTHVNVAVRLRRRNLLAVRLRRRD